MNSWLKNATKNLLPLSLEKNDFNKALKEWSFTGETIDYELAEEICELCEMEGLRYHFQIANEINNLWVGSKCIERFNILVLDEEGTEVSETEREAYLKNRLRDKHIYEVISKLSLKPSDGYLGQYSKQYLDQHIINQFNKHTVDARILNYLFLRLEEESIYYNKKFFEISIKSNYHKARLLSLKRSQFERIKGALTSNQVIYYLKHK